MCKKLLLLSSCLFAVALTSCVQPNSLSQTNGVKTKSLYDKDFRDVCNGSKVAAAAAYDKAPGATSPIIIFYQPGADESYRTEFLRFPGDWGKPYSEIAQTQLVACITTGERREAKVCTFQGAYKLKLMAVKYNVKVYEAQTGALLAEKAFELSAARECPSIEFFSGTESTREPDFTQAATDFLKPFVKH